MVVDDAGQRARLAVSTVADSLTSPPGQRSISDAAGYLLACLSARHRDPTFAPSCLWK